MPDRPPWERRDGESTPAYEAFIAYRDLGLTRSTSQAAARLGKSKALITRWSSRHGWAERAAAYDQHLQRVRDAVTDDEVAAMTRRHLQEARLIQDRAVRRLQKVAADGSDLSAIDAARALALAVKLERLIMGESTENVEQRVRIAQEQGRQLAAIVQAVIFDVHVGLSGDQQRLVLEEITRRIPEAASNGHV